MHQIRLVLSNWGKKDKTQLYVVYKKKDIKYEDSGSK